MATYKCGRMSKKDIEFIRQNMDRLTPEQIQNRIKPPRHLIQIEREIERHRLVEAKPLPSPKSKRAIVSIAERLRMRPDWKKWQKQFSEEELEQFSCKYVELMGQFQEITSTEDMQIISLITNEILHDRVLVAKREIVADMDITRGLLDGAWARKGLEKKEDKIALLMDYIDKLHVDLETYKAQDKELTVELKTYQERMDKAFQSLKATRDQRFKVNENSTRNFLGMLAQLSIETDQKRASEEMLIVYLATEKEKLRLGKPHKYEDGIIDRPLLTEETIDMEDDEED